MLGKFLEPYKIEKGSNVKPTHTSMRGGKWNIPFDKMDEFYNLINTCIIQGSDTLPIVEKIGDIHPLIIDIDIKYSDIISERQYTKDTLLQLLNQLWEHISTHLDISDFSQGEVLLLEKSKVYPCSSSSYKTKDGIHLLFPKIILEKSAYKCMIQDIQQDNIFMEIFQKTCSIPPSNELDTLVDGCFTSWQPYGCSKLNEEYYKLTQVGFINEDELSYAFQSDQILNDMYSDNVQIMKFMSMCRDDFEVNVSYTDHLKNKLKKKSSTSTKQASMNDNIYSNYYIDNNLEINKYQIVEENELKLVKGLVTCLSEKRASSYDSWIKVGMCLHNINKDQLLSNWKQFSQQDNSYDEGECNKKWHSFNSEYSGSKYTMGSLRWWAQQDDPDLFDKVLKESLHKQIETSVSFGPDAHHCLALVIHKYYDKQFICVDINDDWYYFNGVRWEKTLKANELKKRIHKNIHNIFHEYETKYHSKSISEDDPDEKEKWEKKESKCRTFKQKLLQENYVNTIINALKHIFYEKDIMEKLDNQNHLLGFENGIYDLNDNVFREGRPEDYITMSTKIELPVKKEDLPIQLESLVSKVSTTKIGGRHFNEGMPYDRCKQDMEQFIIQIIPDINVRNYIYRWMSKCLSGENRDEGFYMWTGTGGNGKSKLVDLSQNCLGDYSCNLPVSLLTQKRKASNSAAPEMVRTKGVRMVVMQEPDVSETLNIGQMKELTGNDKIQARGLFKEPIEFNPQFKMLLMCNDLPLIPGNDDGTWRRLEVVPFQSRFVEGKEVDESKHRYQIDKELKKKLPFWKIPFLMKLLQEWKEYDTNGIDIPEAVRSQTKSYRNDNDVVGQWIDQCCEIADYVIGSNKVDKYAPSEFDDLYVDFTEWCIEQEMKKPDKKTTREALLKWQHKSSYGIDISKSKADKCVHGTYTQPKFNLKVRAD